MAHTIKVSRVATIVAAVTTLGVATLGFTAGAQAGFFEQLFGAPPPPQPPAPSYYQPEAPVAGPTPYVPHRHEHRREYVDTKPSLQKPTDLMHDKTLHPGDAVMMKTGIHIYTGREDALPNSDNFVPLDDATRIKPAERVALAAIDATRNDPLSKGTAPDSLASGRSAAVAGPLVKGVEFTDQRGHTIRYVGP
jgi:hypothetical protein